MKKPVLLLLFFVTIYHCYSQDTITTFHNSNWEKTVENEAIYVRKSVFKLGIWFVKDFYSSTGTLEKTGQYESVEDDLKHGSFIYYYENGNKKFLGDYYKNYKINLWESWYEQGGVKSKESFTSDTLLVNKMITDGIISAGYTLDVGTYFVNNFGIYNGISEWFFPNGQMSAHEQWGKKLLSIKHWDENGKKLSVDKHGAIEQVVNKGPLPKKDFGKLMDRRKSELENPKLKGKVMVNFSVDTDGTVKDVKVLSSSGIHELDEEAVKMVKFMSGAWNPARNHNLPCKRWLVLPIKFD